MTDDDDYERAEDYIEDYDRYYDIDFADLSNELKVERVTEIFWQGLTGYKESAQELVDGLEARKNYGEIGTGNTVIHVTRRGRKYTVIIDKKTNKYKKWVKI